MKNIALYIHIPFCKSKCYYCDFYSVPAKDHLIDRYLSSLEQEILYFNSCFFNSSTLVPQLSTVYIGGGSPSLLSPGQIKKLFHIITSHFDVSQLKEFNIELNPESISEEKLITLKILTNKILNQVQDDKQKIIKKNVTNTSLAGDEGDEVFTTSNILRFSIGIQSFNDNILKNIGRIHRNKHIISTIKLLNKLKITNYNFDLIFGLPSQDLQDIENDIDQAIDCGPKHISYYALTVEKGTKLYKQKYFPDEDLQSKMYNLILNKLSKKGYNRYEISNFALPRYECKHNLNYWNYGEYLGYGCQAVTFIKKIDNKRHQGIEAPRENIFQRIKNISNLQEYLSKKFKYNTEKIDPETQIKEKIMLGLRTDSGVKLDNEIKNRYKNKINYLINKKYLKIKSGCLKINPKYFFLSNSIISEFF